MEFWIGVVAAIPVSVVFGLFSYLRQREFEKHIRREIKDQIKAIREDLGLTRQEDDAAT